MFVIAYEDKNGITQYKGTEDNYTATSDPNRAKLWMTRSGAERFIGLNDFERVWSLHDFSIREVDIVPRLV